MCDRTGNTYLIGCWCVSVWGARDRIQFILDDGIFCEHTHFMVWPHFFAFLIGNRHIWRNFLIKFIYFFDPSAILFTFCLSVQCSLVRHSLLSFEYVNGTHIRSLFIKRKYERKKKLRKSETKPQFQSQTLRSRVRWVKWKKKCLNKMYRTRTHHTKK